MTSEPERLANATQALVDALVAFIEAELVTLHPPAHLVWMRTVRVRLAEARRLLTRARSDRSEEEIAAAIRALARAAAEHNRTYHAALAEMSALNRVRADQLRELLGHVEHWLHQTKTTVTDRFQAPPDPEASTVPTFIDSPETCTTRWPAPDALSPVDMLRDSAVAIARHTQAALLHLYSVEHRLRAASIAPATAWSVLDLLLGAYDPVADLNNWAKKNQHANGGDLTTYAGTERWCQTAGGTLPT